jgi:hypothetical protein
VSPLFSSRETSFSKIEAVQAVLLCIALATNALTADWSSLYDANRLESERGGLAKDVDLVVAQEIQPFLTGSQAHAFSKLQLDLPAIGELEPNPLDFYSAHPRHITLPLLTVAFVEDMAQAYAWLWANHYSSLTVDEYLGMLRNRAPGDFPAGRYPTPLEALHIPANALDNAAVAQMAQRVRATALTFMLLHQFGHLSYRTAAEQAAMRHDPIEAAEEHADAFALEIMKKNSEIPAGLLMLLHGMLYLPAAPSKAHPVTVRRLDAIADFLDMRVREFAEGQPDRRLITIAIQSLASHIRRAAGFLSDDAGQKLWAEQGSQTTISSLAPRRIGEQR